MTRSEALMLVGYHLPPQLERKRERILGSKRPKAPKKTGILTRAQEKRDAKAERAERRAAVREAAMARDRVSFLTGRAGTELDPLELHHLCGRGDERLATVAMLLRSEHKRIHAGELMAMRALAALCVSNGMADAARVLGRRIAKIVDSQESRRSSGGGTP